METETFYIGDMCVWEEHPSKELVVIIDIDNYNNHGPYVVFDTIINEYDRTLTWNIERFAHNFRKAYKAEIVIYA